MCKRHFGFDSHFVLQLVDFVLKFWKIFITFKIEYLLKTSLVHLSAYSLKFCWQKASKDMFKAYLIKVRFKPNEITWSLLDLIILFCTSDNNYDFKNVH